VQRTLDYLIASDFFLFVQWLNPGYKDHDAVAFDNLGLVSRILSVPSAFSARSGKHSRMRVQEIREFIYGWAKYRNLITSC
jgi:hypothetical protein